MMSIVQRVARQIEEKMNTKGFNIVSNMNEVAGQSVHHFHIHIIPRYQTDDPFHIQYTDRSDDVDLETIYQQIID